MQPKELKIREASTMSVAETDTGVHMVRVHPGSVSPDRKSITVQATKQTTTSELLVTVLAKLNLETQPTENFYLAEICQESGHVCKERRLERSENPVKVQTLWPRVQADDGIDSSTFQTNYRFLLGRINEPSNKPPDITEFKTIDSFVSGFFPHPSTTKEYHDLCNLPDLNEKTLMDNLSARFKQGNIYTYVGSILIAVNPFRFFPIYNPKYVNLYQNHRLGALPPHIFAIADGAFHLMLEEKRNQCIVISGESGSGKTESTNFLIHHLTALSRRGHASGVEQILLGAGPVLEAFGNAKTVVNNNSSRFGKFIQVNYRENGTVHGAVVEQYLLEKSRIVSQAQNERSYHVFYYLLAGATPAEKESLWLEKPDSFHYLNQSNCYTLAGVDEEYEFSRLKQSMEMVGFSVETKRRIFCVLSAVLHIGNIQFKKWNEGEEYVTVKNIATVKVVSDLLKVRQETLMLALTKRKSVARGDQFFVQYRMSEATATRDALAKGLYSALFEWIVLQVNHALLSRYDVKGEHLGNSIGVLDIFGFEDFHLNSFEQFCINYANEHLQYYFNQHVFKLEQEEYQREDIAWKHIEFIDNTSCLLLIEKKPTGLLHILNDDCNFPAKDEEGQNLLRKFIKEHGKNNYFHQVHATAFIIQHYAGKVKYHIKDFRGKNTDLIRPDILKVLKNSNLSFVRELVGADPLAVFRWAIVRAFFRARSAFVAGGVRLRTQGRTPVKKPLSALKSHNDENIQKHVSDLHEPHAYTRNRRSSRSSRSSKKLALLSPGGLCDETYAKARKVLKKNRSFRGAQSQPAKTLRDLNSMRRLRGDKMPGMRRQSQKKTQTVSIQFQGSLNKLMDTLNQANPFFVRCIKSNSEKEPCKLDEKLVMRQLKYTGMLETVRIRQSGYNVRLTFEEFCHRYKLLLSNGLASSVEDIKEFLVEMKLDQKHYQIGMTKVFLRESERIKLQDALHLKVQEKIVLLQWWVRGVLQRRRYLQQQATIIAIQALARGYLVRKEMQAQEERLLAAIFIQNYWRTYCFRRSFLQLQKGVLYFQCLIRGNQARRHLKEMKEIKEETNRLQEEDILRLKDEDDDDRTMVPHIEPLKGGLEEVRSPESDEGILTPDESEDDDDNHRKRTTTMESEESSGILDGSLGSDELLLDDLPQPSSSTQTSDIFVPDATEPETPTENHTNFMFQRNQTRRGSLEYLFGRVKELTRKFQSHIQDRRQPARAETQRSPVVARRHLDKPELQHKPHSLPTSIKEYNELIAGLKEALPPGSYDEEEEMNKEEMEEEDKQREMEIDEQEQRDWTEEEDWKNDDEKLALDNTKDDSKPKRVAAFKIKSNSTDTSDVPMSSPTMQRALFNLSKESIPDSDIEVSPLMGPSGSLIGSPPESPSGRRKSQSHFQKAKHRFRKHFRRKTAEIAEQTNEGSEQTLVDGTSVSKIKRRPSGDSAGPKKSNMNIHGMSQWKYPTNQLISDALELGKMNNFLLTKINDMKSTKSSGGSADQVFKESLKEFRSNLMNTCSVAMQNEGSLNLKYKDLVSNFEKVLESKARKQSGNSQFPVTLGINAFQGFLNEYMQVHKPSNNAHKKKGEQRKKKKDKEDIFIYCGHEYITSQFNIPTACEYCHNFLWLMEKGYVCQVCKFTAHKKCCTKATEHCKGNLPEKVKGRLIGSNLNSLVHGEMCVPPVVERCITCVELNGIYTVGIYRRAGSEVKVKELKHKINTEENLDNIDLNSYNVLCVAQVLKCFFRELPEPLLTFDLYEEFLRTTEIQGYRARLQSLQDTLHKLPSINHDVFERLIFHLARIACHEETNKMSPNALAIVFSPCVLKSKNQMSPWESLQDVSKQAECLELIIREKMKKLQTMLRDITTLERAHTTASLKLSEVRKSRANKLEQQRVLESEEEELVALEQRSMGTSEGSQEVENFWAEQVRTLEREKQDITAHLQSLDLTTAGSEEDNYSVDELDSISLEDVDPSLQAEAPISFELPPSTTALPNLNKRRAPRQPKRLPARYNTANVLGSEPTSQEMNQKAGKQAPKKKGGNK
ncbi:unconventional myosin-IXb-like isoform X6 [Apostichopus japonicus]|uniref:unconventional myosin-IXb-like isoform X6 n=1 Tax=Stichopus japonicus TaxID=307972 RepID=UPI003AB12FC0